MTVKDDIAAFAAGNQTSLPRHLGQRYNTTQFLPQTGNTVVCHLDFNTSTHRAVLAARERMQALPGAEHFLYTPVDSLHMTLFEGVIETRRTLDTWPADIDRDASVERVTEALLPRLAEFSPPPRFAVRVAGLRPSGLILTGAAVEDDAHMRAWREALTKPFGYRHEDHDAYRYHMTFAYPLDWIPDAVLPLWETEFNSIVVDLVKAAPIIPLITPAFCQFADMTYFEELLVLEG